MKNSNSPKTKSKFTSKSTGFVRKRINPKKKKLRQISEAYDYKDENGRQKYQVYRTTPKNFRHRRPNGAGDFIYDMKGVTRLPYNLPELIKSETVYICEGEKDCNNLAEIGLTATTNSGGAGKWRDEFKTYFENKNVIILPDNDEPGKAHGESIAESLYGIAKSLKVVKLPVPEKGDVSDWLKDGNTRKDLLRLVDDTEEWKLAVPDFIQALNKKHAAIMVGGKFAIMNFIWDPSFKRENITFSTVSDFKNCYFNKMIRIQIKGSNETKKINLASAWLKSPFRRQYKGIIFSPGKDEPGYYNMFKGFAIKPKQGNWSLMEEHIQNIICNGKEDLYIYLEAWMARIVQDPGGERPGVCIVLIGKRGTGKGVFITEFGSIFGNHFLHIANQGQLTGRFNSHLREALLVFVDEGFWAGDKKAEGILKSVITEEQILVEEKFKDAFSIKNHVNLFMASNNDWVVPAGLEERRFFVLDISDEKMQDHEYFAALREQISNGGIEAMLHHLMNLDISKVDLRKPPQTEALLGQKFNTMTTLEQFWYERLKEGTIMSNQDRWLGYDGYNNKSKSLMDCKHGTPALVEKYQQGWSDFVVTAILHETYFKFCRNSNRKEKLQLNHFSRRLRKILPEMPKDTRTKLNTGTAGVLQLPSLQECREFFEKIIRAEINWNFEEIENTIEEKPNYLTNSEEDYEEDDPF